MSRSTVIKGDIDWPLAFLSMERGVMSAALLKGGGTKVEEALDLAFDSADVYDCAVSEGDKLRESGDREDAFRTGVTECSPVIAKHLAKAAGGSGKAERLIRWVGGRIAWFLSVPNILKTVRTWVSTLITTPFVVAGMDTSVSIRPTRVMTYDEAAALPVASPSLTSHSCRPLADTFFLPAGMPKQTPCLDAIAADLDGNGKLDRLLAWHPKPGGIGSAMDPRLVGATAYLDDGSFHLLEDPPSTWGQSFDSMGIFSYARKLHLVNQRQDQIYFTAVMGSSVVHGVVLSLDASDRLEVLRYQGDALDLMDGGSAGYSASFGCVLSRGKPLLVQKTTGTDFSASPSARFAWQFDYYAVEGATFDLRGSYSGVSADDGSGSADRSTPKGSLTNCLTVEPTEVGAVSINGRGKLPPGA